MDLGEVGWGDVDWIGLARDRKRWRALVNSVLNCRVASQLVASRVVLSSLELISVLVKVQDGGVDECCSNSMYKKRLNI
jgi:hypothetical protein